MDANVRDKDHNPTNCYLTVTTRIVFDRAADQTRDKKRSGAASPSVQLRKSQSASANRTATVWRRTPTRHRANAREMSASLRYDRLAYGAANNAKSQTSLQGEVKGQADPEAASITLAGVFTRSSKRHALSGAVSGRFLM